MTEPDTVIWDGVQCRGCGKFLGTACIIITLDFEPPAPVFAYAEGDCPICRQRELNMLGDQDPLNTSDPRYVPLRERLRRFKARRMAYN